MVFFYIAFNLSTSKCLKICECVRFVIVDPYKAVAQRFLKHRQDYPLSYQVSSMGSIKLMHGELYTILEVSFNKHTWSFRCTRIMLCGYTNSPSGTTTTLCFQAQSLAAGPGPCWAWSRIWCPPVAVVTGRTLVTGDSIGGCCRGRAVDTPITGRTVTCQEGRCESKVVASWKYWIVIAPAKCSSVSLRAKISRAKIDQFILSRNSNPPKRHALTPAALLLSILLVFLHFHCY